MRPVIVGIDLNPIEVGLICLFHFKGNGIVIVSLNMEPLALTAHAVTEFVSFSGAFHR